MLIILGAWYCHLPPTLSSDASAEDMARYRELFSDDQDMAEGMIKAVGQDFLLPLFAFLAGGFLGSKMKPGD